MKKLSITQRCQALSLGILQGLFGDRKQAGGFFNSSVTGRWEGDESTRFRSRPGRALESQDWGLNFGRREGMLSEARALEQTFPVVRKINRQYGNHVIGSCRMKWNTGDVKMNRIYQEAWKDWMRQCDITGRLTFQKLTKVVVGRVVNDGDIFGQLDRRGGFLQLAAIESDRVSSNGIFNADLMDMIGGIKIDDNGKPVYARIWKRSPYGTFTTSQNVDFNEIVHVYDTDRVDAYRGVSHYHTVLNSARDLLETLQAEKLSAKRNSKIALLMKVLSGAAGASPAVNLFGDTDQTATGTQSITTEYAGDVATVYRFPGEDMKAHESNRPSDGFQWLCEWMVREIATALDLPFGVVWHMAGLGGPAARFEINQANRVFNAFLNDVIEPMWFRPIVGAWITLEMNEGRLPFHPNWYKFLTPRPKSITIDLGRDSKAGIAENMAGLATAANWFIEEDMEFEEQTDQLVYEAKYRMAACQGVDISTIKEVPLEQIRLVTPNGNPDAMLALQTKGQEQKPAEDSDDDDHENKQQKKQPAAAR